MQEIPASIEQPPTIYDVARAAGVSIASVSRVLNGHGNPRPETRSQVLEAVAELGFVPDGAARALSARLKEIVGVVFRRVPWTESHETAEGAATAGATNEGAANEGAANEGAANEGAANEGAANEEDESLQFTDVINRGIEVAAQRRGFSLLVGSVDVHGNDAHRRLMTIARKCDGLILHDQVLEPSQLAQLARQVPVVTLAGVATATTANVRSDNRSGMGELARHLIHDHGYPTLAYLAGHADSPDNLARRQALAEETAWAGVMLADDGPQWQGNYLADGGEKVMRNLLAERAWLPRAIVCANDQTALGVMHELARHGIDVPGEIAVTGFDDIPVARHLRPQLTTVRQPIQELGAMAFDLLRSMIGKLEPNERDLVLPTRLVLRQSCGCGGTVSTANVDTEGGRSCG